MATAAGRRVGPRVALSVRTPVQGSALAIAARGEDLAIAVAGDGVDIALWAQAPDRERGDARR